MTDDARIIDARGILDGISRIHRRELVDETREIDGQLGGEGARIEMNSLGPQALGKNVSRDDADQHPSTGSISPSSSS